MSTDTTPLLGAADQFDMLEAQQAIDTLQRLARTLRGIDTLAEFLKTTQPLLNLQRELKARARTLQSRIDLLTSTVDSLEKREESVRAREQRVAALEVDLADRNQAFDVCMATATEQIVTAAEGKAQQAADRILSDARAKVAVLETQLAKLNAEVKDLSARRDALFADFRRIASGQAAS